MSQLLNAEDAIARFKLNEQRADIFVNEFGHYDTNTDPSVEVESLPSFMQRKETELNAFGVVANGETLVSNEATLIAANGAGSVTSIVLLTSFAMTQNITLTKPFRPKPGAIITTTGYTLTINSSFEAGVYQVFAGTGTVAGLKEARPEWWGNNTTPGTTDMTAILQRAVNASKIVTISSILGVSAPINMQNGQTIVIDKNGGIKAITGFAGTAVLIADAGGSDVTQMQDGKIKGAGYIDCGGLVDRGIWIKAGRRIHVRGLKIVGANLYGIHLGDSAASISSYECDISDVLVNWIPGSDNNANSKGIWHERCSDSNVVNSVVVGYRRGFQNDVSPVFYNGAHAWTVPTYGPMDRAFGAYSRAHYTNCSADTPTSIGNSGAVGSISEVYGWYLSAYGCTVTNSSVFLSSSYADNNKAVGIYVGLDDGLFGSISNIRMVASPTAKFKSIIGWSGTGIITNTNIFGIEYDGNSYSALNSINRMRASLHLQDTLRHYGTNTYTETKSQNSGTNGQIYNIDPLPADAVSESVVRIGRNVNTSGSSSRLSICKMDGTSTETAAIYADGTFESKVAGNGLILKTPDGTKRYKITINNSGAVISTLVS